MRLLLLLALGSAEEQTTVIDARPMKVLDPQSPTTGDTGKPLLQFQAGLFLGADRCASFDGLTGGQLIRDGPENCGARVRFGI
jgi:hypothetical protein